MMKEKSCGAVVFKNDKVLIVKQNDGHFGFPKGHIEFNETEEETAIREVKEETNVSIDIDSNCRYLVTYSPSEGITKDVVYFLAYAKNDDTIPQEEEISKVMWLFPEKAFEVLTYDQSRDVLQFVLDYKAMIVK